MPEITGQNRYGYIYPEETYAPVQEKPLRPELLRLRGISAQNMQEHYKLYQGYVRKTNEIRKLLRTADRPAANPNYSQVRELKVEESYTTNGAKLHELFFNNLGGPGGQAPEPLDTAIVRCFGSSQFWEEDFKATGLSARGWAILSWDRDYQALHNYSLDAHNLGMIARIEPLLVMDVYEHAYYLDYGTNRKGYVDAFMLNIDWRVVTGRYQLALSS